MSKGTTKRSPKDRIKTQAVVWVANKYKVDKNYIYSILNGTFKYGIATEVKKSYSEKYDELKSILS